jgi:outer membrane protein
VKGAWLNTMKKQTFLTLVIGIFAASFFLPAFAADTLKIGVVDAQRIIEESKAGKAAYQQLKELQEQHKQSVEAKKVEIDKSEQELQKQYATLSETAKAEKEETLKKAKTDFKRMLEDADNDINNKEKAFLEKIDKEVMEIIKKLGKDEGFTLIMSKAGSSILYTNNEMDLTEKVVKLYDQKQQ